MPNAITAFLEALYSERDRNGNCYWALRFTDCATGKVVVGKVSGDESNIYAILRNWNPDLNDWDRSISFRVVALKKRDFEATTGDWQYAGCSPEDLVSFIRKGLGQETGQVNKAGFGVIC